MTETLVRGTATREDYDRLPEGPPYYELIDGVLEEMTRPLGEHIQVFQTLLGILLAFGNDQLGGRLWSEPNLYLPGGESVLHPDLCFVSRGSGIDHSAGIYGAPEMVCEILSPTTQRTDRYRKMPIYRQAGVRHLWLIDPHSPFTVEEFHLREEGDYAQHAVVAAPAVWRPAIFPGCEIPLARLDAAVTDLPD